MTFKQLLHKISWRVPMTRVDNPDPCRDLHRPRDQRLPAGRVLIRNPVLHDPREERARHRAQCCGRLRFGASRVRKLALPSRLMASARFFLTLLLTPDLRADAGRGVYGVACADPARRSDCSALSSVARLITSQSYSAAARTAALLRGLPTRALGIVTTKPSCPGPPRSATGT